MNEALHSRFSPSSMPAALLEQTLVQRHDLAQRLVELFVESAEGQSKHHVLLVGPRGIGKSHLAALVYHRLMASGGTASKLAIAWLDEDEWGVASFLDLLVKIMRALGLNTKEDVYKRQGFISFAAGNSRKSRAEPTAAKVMKPCSELKRRLRPGL